MLSKNIFNWVHRVALFAVVFASLAPSISHALAAQQGVNSFAQAICTTDGEIIKIDVVTTQGQQLSTTLLEQEEAPSPASIAHHLNHCPFCSNPNTDHGLAAPSLPIIAFLERQAKQLAATTQAALLPRFSVLPPPAQAPPSL